MTRLRLALFDLDGTLLPGDSDHAFGEYLVRLGWVDEQAYRRRNDAFFADYLAGRLDVNAYVEFSTAGWRGHGAAELAALRAGFMQDVVEPMLRPPALELVKRHQDAGSPAGDQPLLAYAIHDGVNRIETALSGALRNFPIRPVGWLLWALIFPLGRRAQAPSASMSAPLPGARDPSGR